MLASAGIGWVFFSGGSEAADLKEVKPAVIVTSTGSFTVGGDVGTDGKLDFGTMAAGANSQKTVSFLVTANDAWQITVYKNHDLREAMDDPGIPSGNFKFTLSGPGGVTTPAEFPPEASKVKVSNSSSGGNFNITVTYDLTIPETQPASATSYTATHYYTLIVGGG